MMRRRMHSVLQLLLGRWRLAIAHDLFSKYRQWALDQTAEKEEWKDIEQKWEMNAEVMKIAVHKWRGGSFAPAMRSWRFHVIDLKILRDETSQSIHHWTCTNSARSLVCWRTVCRLYARIAASSKHAKWHLAHCQRQKSILRWHDWSTTLHGERQVIKRVMATLSSVRLRFVWKSWTFQSRTIRYDETIVLQVIVGWQQLRRKVFGTLLLVIGC